MGNASSEDRQREEAYLRGLKPRAQQSTSTFLSGTTGLRREVTQVVITPTDSGEQAAPAQGIWMSSPDLSDVLFVDRGPEGGEMKTGSLEYVLSNKFAYRLRPHGFELLGPWEEHAAADLDDLANNPPFAVEEPPYFEVRAEWIAKTEDGGDGNNILGDNGRLYIPSAALQVPAVVATSATLAYYGAFIVADDTVCRFPSRHFPIFNMTVGDRYVDDFIMTPAGGGYYLEYHNDQPHFHRVLKGSGNGIYLLAKWNDDKTHIRMTGFKLPVGAAVYSKRGIIHCDSPLSGEALQVGYTIAHDFSTVLLRFNSAEGLTPVRIEFVDAPEPDQEDALTLLSSSSSPSPLSDLFSSVDHQSPSSSSTATGDQSDDDNDESAAPYSVSASTDLLRSTDASVQKIFRAMDTSTFLVPCQFVGPADFAQRLLQARFTVGSYGALGLCDTVACRQVPLVRIALQPGASVAALPAAGGSSPYPVNVVCDPDADPALFSRLLPVVFEQLTRRGGVPGLSEPPIWVPDSSECCLCRASFSLLRRRHHCRSCGVCVCQSCLPAKTRLPFGGSAPVPVCARCAVARAQTIKNNNSALAKIRPFTDATGSPRLWNVRAPFKRYGVVEIGTHMSVYKLASGRFLVLDTVPLLTGRLASEFDALVDGGRLIEAVLALHPFHTAAFLPFFAKYPDAPYYGTPRHIRTLPTIRWTGNIAEHLDRWQPEIEMRIPCGAEFADPQPEHANHFSSVWLFARPARVLHVDDTLFIADNPSQILRANGIRPGMNFHPSIHDVGLLPRPDSPELFAAWLQKIIDDWDFDAVCAAHNAVVPSGAKQMLRQLLLDSRPLFTKLAEKFATSSPPPSNEKTFDCECG